MALLEAEWEEQAERTAERVIHVASEHERNVRMHGIPIAIAREGVLLEYCVNTGVDEVLAGTWQAIFDADIIVPNPYPFIVHRLRSAMYRFALFKETDAELLLSVLNEIKRVDEGGFLYTDRETRTLYGLYTAVRLASPDAVQQMLPLIADVANNDNTLRIGSNRLQVRLS